jgi:D-tyrosyl-tRNA(Tyr) deacylase
VRTFLQDERMRAVVQVVTSASVTAVSDDGERRVTGGFDEPGLVVLVGATHDDTTERAGRLADKIWQLRVMDDERSASDLGAPLLVVSQFTLYADLGKGRRPSWSAAAPRPVSEPLVEAFCSALRSRGAQVETGVFGADMALTLVNDGPRTIIVDV